MRFRFSDLLGICAAALCAGLTFAADKPQEADVVPAPPFYQGKEEGWFWYKDPKEEEEARRKDEKPILSAPASTAKKKDEPFSVEWLRLNMPVLLDKAINEPTKENVEAFLYAQRIAMDKSQRYAEKAREVVALDPLLDENNRVPLATFAKREFLSGMDKGVAEGVKHLAGVGGIWMFYDSRCDHCKTQAATIEELKKRFGFHVKYIALDGKPLPIKGVGDNESAWGVDSGLARALNVTVAPTTVLVVPPNNFFIVSQGMMAQDQLMERLIIAADANGLLPANIASAVRAYSKGILTASDTQSGATDDPRTWVRAIKGRLQGRY